MAWALAADNKTIVDADTDGYRRITIMSADRIEKCYAQSAAGPRRAIVATCFMMDRVKNRIGQAGICCAMQGSRCCPR